jgi:hypothetical protein
VIFDMRPVIEHVALRDYGRETNDIPCYNLEEVYGLTASQAKELILTCQADHHLRSELLMPGAKQVLEAWAYDTGHPITVVTARPRTGPVGEYLSSVLAVDHIQVHSSHSEDKGEVAYRLGLEAFVDDYWVSLLSCMRFGIRAVLFSQPWNRRLPSARANAYNGMVRVTGWDGLLAHLQGIGVCHDSRQAGTARYPR